MHPQRYLATLAACGAVLGGCTASDPLRQQREWFEVSAGVVTVDERTPDELGSASGWRLGSGYDLNADPLLVSLEADVQWSYHDVRAQPRVDAKLSSWTIGMGLRGRWCFEGAPLNAFARSGLAWRQESVSDDRVEDIDSVGYYYGLGLEWRYSESGALGPSMVWFRDLDGDVETYFFSISVRFLY